MSESERIGAERSLGARYISRKEAAAVLDKHPKTVEDWEKAGAFQEVIRQGRKGKVSIRADAAGAPLMSPGWSMDGQALADAAAGFATLDPAVAREGVREAARIVMTLPPMPDPVTTALKAGEPDVVVAARAEAHGRIVAAGIYVAGFILVALVGAWAYLRRHKLVPPLRGA